MAPDLDWLGDVLVGRHDALSRVLLMHAYAMGKKDRVLVLASSTLVVKRYGASKQVLENTFVRFTTPQQIVPDLKHLSDQRFSAVFLVGLLSTQQKSLESILGNAKVLCEHTLKSKLYASVSLSMDSIKCFPWLRLHFNIVLYEAIHDDTAARANSRFMLRSVPDQDGGYRQVQFTLCPVQGVLLDAYRDIPALPEGGFDTFD